MNNRTVILLILGIALFMGLFIFTQYEYRDVPNHKPATAYKLDSKYAEGLWMFHNLLKETFPDKQIEVVDLDSLEGFSNASLFAVHGQPRFNTYKPQIFDFLKQGNEVFISSNGFYAFSLDSTYQFPDDVEDIKYYYEYTDSISSDNHLITYQSPPFPQAITDTVPTSSMKYFTDTTDAIIKLNDIYSIATYFDLDTGALCYHSAPHFFTNQHLATDMGLRHFYHCMSLITNDTVLIYDPTTYRVEAEVSKDYLSYILSERSLKTAYFLSLAGMLLFIIFNSKRVQRKIPVQHKNRNTLGEYIDTLTDLNYSIGDKSQLIKTMEQTFFHTVYGKFYIEKGDENFVKKFSKKSKIPERQIEVILRRFKEANSGHFNTDQLTALYHRIQTVYQIIGN